MTKQKKQAKRYALYDHRAEKSKASSRVIGFNKRTGQVKVTKKVLAVKVNTPVPYVEETAHEYIEPIVQQVVEGDIGVRVTKKHAKRYLNSVSKVLAVAELSFD